jgi:HK97 family phage portal protein
MPFLVTSGQLASLDRSTAPIISTGIILGADLQQDYATIWRTQPQVRTVISFLARNIAQLGLHVYQRVSDTDRQRLTDHPLATVLGKPNQRTTRYRLIDSLVQDLAVYDDAYWLKLRDNPPGGLLRLPPHLVTPVGGSPLLAADTYRVRGNQGNRDIPAEQIVHFRGHDPVDARSGASPIETLRRILAEEYQAAAYREQLWRNGARMGGYLRRPADAPDWSEKARGRFRADWQQQYTGDGPNAGGTPILEDGMEWVQGGMTPEQAQYLEARKLTREEVAAAFHIPLPMVGILDHATFSNITEQHKQLYQDTLGPWLTMICEEIELQLLPDLGPAPGIYVEFNLQEKLRGSFEEQAQQLQTAVGAPWLTRNEARARMNLPQIDGGDELVTPLNVLIGGQASPTNTAPAPGQNARRAGGAGVKDDGASRHRPVKARADQTHIDTVHGVLARFFDRQKKVLLSRLGKADVGEVWDDQRWDTELADDLEPVSASVAADAAAATLTALGLDPADYNPARAAAWLRRHAEGVASGINGRTRTAVGDALKADDPLAAIRDLFDGVIAARAAQIAVTNVTALSGFGTSEAVQQTGRTARKTWSVASRNPRPSHSALSGETVGMDELFSNGARWPGDSLLPDDERAGCTCEMDITVEDS